MKIPPTLPRLAHDRNWKDAGKLLAERGIAAENHAILQENVATYLSHRSCLGNLPERWQSKLHRDLCTPYSDDQVEPRVDALQASLWENLQELPVFPSQVYLSGSFSRGRLGPHSDLDGYALLPPDKMSRGLDCFEKRVSGPGACLVPLNQESPGLTQANLMSAGASVAIDPSKLAQPGYLRKVYHHVQQQRPQRRETSSLFEWATQQVWAEELSAREKREQLEGKTLASRLTQGLLSLAGGLARLPVVGVAVESLADLAVNQVHLDQPDL
jgi:hypothetical protein